MVSIGRQTASGAGPDILGLISQLFGLDNPNSPVGRVMRPFPNGTPTGPQATSPALDAVGGLGNLIKELFINPLADPAKGSPIDQVINPTQGSIPVGQPGPPPPPAGPPAPASSDDLISKIAELVGGSLPTSISAAAQAPVASVPLSAAPTGPAMGAAPVAPPPVAPAPAPPPDAKQAIADTAISADDASTTEEGAGDEPAATDESDTVDPSAAVAEAQATPDQPAGYDAGYPYPQMMPSTPEMGPAPSGSAVADFIQSMMGGDTGTPADGEIVNPDRAGYGEGPSRTPVLNPKGTREMTPTPSLGGSAEMGSGQAIHAPIMNIDVGSQEASHQPGYMARAKETVRERGSTAQPAAETAKRDPTEAIVQAQAIETARREGGGTPDVVDTGYGGRPTGGVGGGGTGEGRSNTTYTIKKGDSLYKIAQRVYGDPNRWREIAKANKLSVRNPNKIFTGQTLTLPGPGGGAPTPRERPIASETVTGGQRPPR